MNSSIRLSLARSLAQCNSISLNKISASLNIGYLTAKHESLVLDSKCRETIIALCVYLLDSNLRFAKTFIPLLEDVLVALPKAEWVVLPEEQNAFSLPVAECFTFAFIALFSEIAHRRSKRLSDIGDDIEEDDENESETDNPDDVFIDTYVSTIRAFVETVKQSSYHESLCKYTVPSLFGLLRGFARVSPYRERHVADVLFPSSSKRAERQADGQNEADVNSNVNNDLETTNDQVPTSRTKRSAHPFRRALSRSDSVAAGEAVVGPFDSRLLVTPSRVEPAQYLNGSTGDVPQRSLRSTPKNIALHPTLTPSRAAASAGARLSTATLRSFTRSALFFDEIDADELFGSVARLRNSSADDAEEPLPRGNTAESLHYFFSMIATTLATWHEFVAGECCTSDCVGLFIASGSQRVLDLVRSTLDDEQLSEAVDVHLRAFRDERRSLFGSLAFPYAHFSCALRLNLLRLARDLLRFPDALTTEYLASFHEHFAATLPRVQVELVSALTTTTTTTNTNTTTTTTTAAATTATGVESGATNNGGAAGVSTPNEEDSSSELNVDSEYETVLKVRTCTETIQLVAASCVTQLDAQSLCVKLCEHLFISSPSSDALMRGNARRNLFRLIIVHNQILLNILNQLGSVAERFAELAGYIVGQLKDFLLKPAQVLYRMARYCVHLQNSSQSQSQSLSQSSVAVSVAVTGDGETTQDGLVAQMQARELAKTKLLKIFELLRDCAIHNLCRALAANVANDPNCIRAFIAWAAARCYAVENLDRESNLVSANAVLTLGQLAVEFMDDQQVLDNVYTTLLQHFCKPPSPVDNLILEQFALLIIAGCKSKFGDILTLFSQVSLNSSMTAASDQAVQQYKHVSVALQNALWWIAQNLPVSRPVALASRESRCLATGEFENEPLYEYLLKLLELFAQYGLAAERLSGRGNVQVKTTNYGGNLATLIAPIAAAMRRLPPIRESTAPRVLSLFRDFWMLCTVLGFPDPYSVWPRNVFFSFDDLCVIAARSPVLTSGGRAAAPTGKSFLSSGLQHATVIKAETLSKNVEDMRTRLLRTLELTSSSASAASGNTLPAGGGPPQSSAASAIISNRGVTWSSELIQLVSNLPPFDVAFLLSVCYLETLCAQHSTEPRVFERLFTYVEESLTSKDKSGISRPLLVLAAKTCSAFLTAVSSQPKTSRRDELILLYAQFLLTQFNSVAHQRIRRMADECLVELVQRFSFVLWNSAVLKCMLDILQLLAYAIHLESNTGPISVEVPGTPYRLQIASQFPDRESTLKDFTGRARSWIQEAIKWVPNSTCSYLVQYIVNCQRAQCSALTCGIGSGAGSGAGATAVANGALNSTAGVTHVYDTIVSFLNTQTPANAAGGSTQATAGVSAVVKVQSMRSTAAYRDDRSQLSSGVSTGSGFSSASGVGVPQKQPDREPTQTIITTSSYFITQIQLRNLYVGEVSGMRAMCADQHDLARLIRKLCADADRAASTALNAEEYQRALYRACALAIALERDADATHSRRLLRLVAFAPLHALRERQFAVAARNMETAIACWNWLLIARADLQLPLLAELCTAWQFTIDARLGVFVSTSRHLAEFDPRSSPIESAGSVTTSLRPLVPFAHAHVLFARFLHERLEVARANSPETVQLFASLVLRSFSTTNSYMMFPLSSSMKTRMKNVDDKLAMSAYVQTTGRYEPGGTKMSSHITAIGVRFRVALIGLSIIQGEYLPPAFRHSLRARIYANLLDFFAMPMQLPLQSGAQLADDIQTTLQLFEAVCADRKYVGAGLVQAASAGGSISPTHSIGGVGVETQSVGGSMQQVSSTTGRHLNSVVVPSVVAGVPKSSQSVVGSAPRGASRYRDRRLLSNHEGALELARKRNLLAALLLNELQRLIVWYNPIGLPELQIADEERKIWQARSAIQDRSLPDYVTLAWRIDPQLAVQLYERYRNDRVLAQLRLLVKRSPLAVSHVPAALEFLTTRENLETNVDALSHVLYWARSSPIQAIAYLCPRLYPTHAITAQYAFRVLEQCSSDVLIFYAPQLVQATRYDSIGFVSELLLALARKSQLFAHQLIWNMKTNIYKDGEMKYRSDIAATLEALIEDISRELTGPEQAFYEREFGFFDEITNVSAAIKSFKLGEPRKQACLEALAKVELKSGCYLPSNPEAVVLEIDKLSGRPMQSHAKAPYLARFRVRRFGCDELERIGLAGGMTADVQPKPAPAPTLTLTPTASAAQKRSATMGGASKTKAAAAQRDDEYWQAAIFKVGDDVRQDILALQSIGLMRNIIQMAGLDLFLFPYRVVATGPGCGVIECVPNSRSRDEIGRTTEIDLHEYFIREYGDENSPKYQAAQKAFIMSMAAYSIPCYLLQIKDRHNGNLMLDKDGHIIHIDFGFLFDSSPGGNIGFEPSIKISGEMLRIMGGTAESHSFQWYMQLCAQAYLAIRRHHQAFIALVSLMLDTELPCFRGNSISTFESRFRMAASEREAAQHFIGVINESLLNWRSKAYDQFQYLQNKIPY